MNLMGVCMGLKDRLDMVKARFDLAEGITQFSIRRIAETEKGPILCLQIPHAQDISVSLAPEIKGPPQVIADQIFPVLDSLIK